MCAFARLLNMPVETFGRKENIAEIHANRSSLFRSVRTSNDSSFQAYTAIKHQSPRLPSLPLSILGFLHSRALIMHVDRTILSPLAKRCSSFTDEPDDLFSRLSDTQFNKWQFHLVQTGLVFALSPIPRQHSHANCRLPSDHHYQSITVHCPKTWKTQQTDSNSMMTMIVSSSVILSDRQWHSWLFPRRCSICHNSLVIIIQQESEREQTNREERGKKRERTALRARARVHTHSLPFLIGLTQLNMR